MDTNATINLRQIIKMIEQIHTKKYFKKPARTDTTEIGMKLPGLSKSSCTFMNWSICDHEHFLSEGTTPLCNEREQYKVANRAAYFFQEPNAIWTCDLPRASHFVKVTSYILHITCN